MALYANDSLRYYKEDGYLEINQSLRNHLTVDAISPEIRQHIFNIDKKMVLPKQTYKLYRGYSNLRKLLVMLDNPILIEKAYSSCTTSLETTFGFVKDENEYSKCCIMEFLLSPESNIKIYEFRDERREKEILLERGVQFTITHERQKKVNGVFYTIFTAVVSKYTPPIIPEKVIEKTLEMIESESKSSQASSSSLSNDELLEEITQEAKSLLDLQFMDDLMAENYLAITKLDLEQAIAEASLTNGYSLSMEQLVDVKRRVLNLLKEEYGGQPELSRYSGITNTERSFRPDEIRYYKAMKNAPKVSYSPPPRRH